MKTLVLADIHNKIDIVDRIIREAKADQVVCLGDYWDDMYDTPAAARDVAKWWKDLNAKKICGNHDLPYLFPETTRWSRNSGWTYDKSKAISEVLGDTGRDDVSLFQMVDGWLLTHAGLSKGMGYMEDLIRAEKDLKAGLYVQTPGKILGIGRMRGGWQDTGGVQWCDWNEFKPRTDFKQIFGHTPHEKPVWKQHNLGLDTRLKHYAVIEDGNVTVHPTPGMHPGFNKIRRPRPVTTG